MGGVTRDQHEKILKTRHKAVILRISFREWLLRNVSPSTWESCSAWWRSSRNRSFLRTPRETLSVLKSEGYQQCSFIEGTLESLEQIEGDRFDLVFARLLLMHLDDPILGLRQMYGQVRPGGRIVVQDYYFPAVDSYPPVEAFAEFKKVFFGVYNEAGRDTRTGIKLPGLFIEAGIGPPDGTDVSGFLLPSRVGAEMLAAVYRSVLPVALKHGLTTERQSLSFLEELRKSQSANCYILWPLLVSAWRQKAAEDRS